MKIRIITLGCKVNQYESQAILEQFSQRGWETTNGIADLYLINTCTVTRRADAKSREAIARARRQNPKAVIAVCGCLTELNKPSIEKLGVDFIIPQEKKHLLADIITGAHPLHRPGVSPANIWSLTVNEFVNKRAFLKAQDGCDNACSFCKIPHVRGASRSRPFRETLNEAQRLIAHHPEIVLCGINLGLYGRDLIPKRNLTELVCAILGLQGLGRLRISSLEPRLIDRKFLECYRHPKLCPHIHLPFQSGDDAVLAAMNKKETAAAYRAIVKDFRSIQPQGAVSCDIMVGFPGETDKEFKNTVDFIKEIQPMRVHVFTFSPREKTKYSDTPPSDQKTLVARSKIVAREAERLAKEYALQFIGKTLTMVAEEYHQDLTVGYTENYLKITIKKKIPLGSLVPVRVTRVTQATILGILEN